MLGALLSLISAVSFAYANAAVRRGVLTGSVTQAVAISLVVALPIFAIAMTLTGGFALLPTFSWKSLVLLALAGIIHFGWARHCNYQATKAMGANLVAPIQQYSLVITLFLAIAWLGEAVTALRIVGIILVVVGPAFTLRPQNEDKEGAAQGAKGFRPDLAKGYFYAFLSAIGFGISPILIAEAFHDKGIALGLAGGFVSYVAASAVMGLPLLRPKAWQALGHVDRESAKWFIVSGLAVGVSQMTRYMALAVAPVSVVAPITRLSLVFRLYFGAQINRDHEVFGGRVVWATAISLLGALALSVSTDVILEGLPLPETVASVLRWRLFGSGG